MDYSERRMRAEIEKIPDGRYVFEDYMEDDGIEDQRLQDPRRGHGAAAAKSSSTITAVRRRRKGRSTARSAWRTARRYNAILQLTNSTIPKNSGCFRPIRVLAPPGSGGERELSRPVGRRQHRDALPHRQCGDGRASARR